MIIASQKRKENIAEYLLYMWQIEDIIRAYKLDIDTIDEQIVSKYNVPDDKKKDGVEKFVVKGKVVDDAGQTLPGVTILLKGTTIGVVTDIDGKFKMELPKQDSLILIFSFVGMETQHLDVNKMKDLSKEVTVRMKAEIGRASCRERV